MTTFCTKAFVASFVLLSEVAGVGPVTAPVKLAPVAVMELPSVRDPGAVMFPLLRMVSTEVELLPIAKLPYPAPATF